MGVALQGDVELFSHRQFGAVLAARWSGLSVADEQHLALSPASIGILGETPGHGSVAAITPWNLVPGPATTGIPFTLR